MSDLRPSQSTGDNGSHTLSRADFTVACICPMGVELAAVEGMLDNIHAPLPTSCEQNTYTLGELGAHKMVVAIVPQIGINAAATVATQLLNDFPSVRFVLLVGISSGVPGQDGKDDVRLGDVVVGQPTGTFGGIEQFDMGKDWVMGHLSDRDIRINRLTY